MQLDPKGFGVDFESKLVGECKNFVVNKLGGVFDRRQFLLARALVNAVLCDTVLPHFSWLLLIYLINKGMRILL